MRATASSKVAYGVTVVTGAKTSSQFTCCAGVVPVRTVGCSSAPVRLAPVSTFAPSATAAAIHDSARRAASSLIIGPTSVAGSSGSPTRRFPTRVTNRTRNSSNTSRCTRIRCTEMHDWPAYP